MRGLLRFLGIGGGLALLVFGMLQKSDGVWLAALWGGMLLVGIGASSTVQALHGGVRRGILNLALVFSLLFVALTVQLLRTQFVRADEIYDRVVTDAKGNVTGNPRPVTRSMKVQRGRIVDRQGTLLVGSTANPQGYAKRTYPIAQQADIRAFSNILGYTSPSYGQSGLEQRWNDYLTGAIGQPLRSLESEVLHRPMVGDDMQLTIDARLQDAVWKIMAAQGQGKPGSAVVLQPNTGAILALASVPGYDPQALTFDPFADDWDAMNQRINEYWNQINADDSGLPLINRPLKGVYPPGSTFKAVTAIASLAHPEVLNTPQAIDCPNEYRPDQNAPPVVNAVGPPLHMDQPPLGQIINDRMGGKTDLMGVFAFSCNTAFGQLGVRLGQERLTEQARLFNFFPPREAPDDSPDMTDLPTSASLLALRGTFLESTPLALADTAFGQGQLQVTPMQMALVAASIANNGVMAQPYLVERITDPEGATAYEHRQRAGKTVMTPQIAAQMRELMRAGVTTGYGKAAAVPGQSVGGKSGSAQVGAGDNPNALVHAWFIAIAPVENPRYAVAVMIENGRDGAGVGAATAGQVLKAAFDLEQQ